MDVKKQNIMKSRNQEQGRSYAQRHKVAERKIQLPSKVLGSLISPPTFNAVNSVDNPPGEEGTSLDNPLVGFGLLNEKCICELPAYGCSYETLNANEWNVGKGKQFINQLIPGDSEFIFGCTGSPGFSITFKESSVLSSFFYSILSGPITILDKNIVFENDQSIFAEISHLIQKTISAVLNKLRLDGINGAESECGTKWGNLCIKVCESNDLAKFNGIKIKRAIELTSRIVCGCSLTDLTESEQPLFYLSADASQKTQQLTDLSKLMDLINLSFYKQQSSSVVCKCVCKIPVATFDVCSLSSSGKIKLTFKPIISGDVWKGETSFVLSNSMQTGQVNGVLNAAKTSVSFEVDASFFSGNFKVNLYVSIEDDCEYDKEFDLSICDCIKQKLDGITANVTNIKVNQSDVSIDVKTSMYLETIWKLKLSRGSSNGQEFEITVIANLFTFTVPKTFILKYCNEQTLDLTISFKGLDSCEKTIPVNLICCDILKFILV